MGNPANFLKNPPKSSYNNREDYVHRLEQLQATQEKILAKVSGIELALAEILMGQLTNAPRVVGSVKG